MNVYTVHMNGSPKDPAALERSVFICEGFSWGAFFFGPLWLLRHRLWVALSVWLAISAGLALWAEIASPTYAVIGALEVLIQLALGFEAAELRRAGLSRRRFEVVGLVQGRRMRDAERDFFSHPALALRTDAGSAGLRHNATRPTEMVGLFPSAGA